MNKTGYFTHPIAGARHGPGHPECPERLDAIEDRCCVTRVRDALERREAPLAAPRPRAGARPHARGAIAAWRRTARAGDAGGRTTAHIDPDTALNRHTWNAALRAAGAAMAATDAVMAASWRTPSAPCARPATTPAAPRHGLLLLQQRRRRARAMRWSATA
jgi:acetoin utilization deacetylase AcuC-like enzyme